MTKEKEICILLSISYLGSLSSMCKQITNRNIVNKYEHKYTTNLLCICTAKREF